MGYFRLRTLSISQPAFSVLKADFMRSLPFLEPPSLCHCPLRGGQHHGLPESGPLIQAPPAVEAPCAHTSDQACFLFLPLACLLTLPVATCSPGGLMRHSVPSKWLENLWGDLRKLPRGPSALAARKSHLGGFQNPSGQPAADPWPRLGLRPLQVPYLVRRPDLWRTSACLQVSA